MSTEERELPHKGPQLAGGEETTEHSLSIQRRCCCCIPIFSSNRSRTVGLPSWDRVRAAAENEERWWSVGVRALMKFREWSEIVAGPRWKTFIRRFNRTRSGGGSGSGGRNSRKFQYDPLSYSLNFDEGHLQNSHTDDDDDDYGGLRDFSSRYASVSVSVRA